LRSTFVCVLTLLICNLVWRESGTPCEHAIEHSPVLSLDQAMESRLLRVREHAHDRGDVLQFANAADRPVVALAGKVILGRDHDHVVLANTLIAPHATQPVPVRCVEPERIWICDRHLYPSYLGDPAINAACSVRLHPYPGYLGHPPGGQGRLHRTDDGLPVAN